jgi:hypothetical protein
VLFGRHRHLLSDGELGQQLFATMLPDLDDCLEQCKLSTDDAMHPLAEYGERDRYALFPGTEKLAHELGIKHPKLFDEKQTALWRSTTDLVLVFKPLSGPRHMLALAFKTNDWNTNRRTIELLRLEREFWVRRGVPWLLITPKQYDLATRHTLQRIACWSLGDEVTSELRQLTRRICIQNAFSDVTQLLRMIQAHGIPMEVAQRALWQTVWRGELPIDLRRGWRPHVPLKHISLAEFINLNPIASRRSAWI